MNIWSLSTLIGIGFCMGCSSVPIPKFRAHHFPKEGVYVEAVKRPSRSLGLVRSKVNFQSLDPNHDEMDLCKNYYNEAVGDLLKMARDKGADAVVDVKSVVFLEDGTQETYITPECSDDGFQGQILTQGIAVQWIDEKTINP